MSSFSNNKVRMLDWVRARVTKKRGSLTITLSDPSLSAQDRSGARARLANPGELIEGFVHLQAEQGIGPGRVIVTLVGSKQWEVTELRDDNIPHTSKKTKDFYEQSVVVAENLSVGAGLSQSVPFAIASPQPDEAVGPGPGIGKALGMLNATRYSDATYRWELVARFDARGPDLLDRHRIWAGVGAT